MSNSTTLVRSTMLAAVAGVTFFATNADAGIYVNDYATYAADATAGGLAQQYVETFEENTFGGAYQILDHPLTYGVPNQSFATGLNAPGLTVDTSDLGVDLDLFTGPGNPYFTNLTSDCVGPNNPSGAMVASFDGGISAVALDVISLTQFVGAAFDELNYWVYDTDGVLMDTGILALDGTIYNSLGFYYDGSDIGRFELEGFGLGLDSAEVLDNIEGWARAATCAEDVDADGMIGFSDLLSVLSNWGPCVGCPEDIDGNDDVGFSDLLAVLSNWGPCE